MPVDQNQLEIKSKLKNYKAYFASDTNFLAELIATKNSLFVIDKNLWNLHKETSLDALKDVSKIILEVDEDKKIWKLYKFFMMKSLNYRLRKI